MAQKPEQYKKPGTIKVKIDDKAHKAIAHCTECSFKSEAPNQTTAIAKVFNHAYNKHDWNPFGSPQIKRI